VGKQLKTVPHAHFFVGVDRMNIFQKLFRKKADTLKLERAEMLNGQVVQFSAWNGDAYSSDIFRSGVDAIARNAGKLRGGHVIQGRCEDEPNIDRALNRLLQVQPNPYMNAYDMIYKLVTHTFLYNNGFAYLQREGGRIVGIYPILGSSVDFMIDPLGVMYCRFLFRSGKSVILPYSDIIHLRRHFNDNDMFGDTNSAISPALELSHTQNEGIISGIKNRANIRGILKYSQLLSPEKLKEEKDSFIADYLTISNDGGVIALDSKMEYEPLKLEPSIIDDKQLESVKVIIFNYLGVSESIVKSNYTEDEWAAFYESVIEPLAVQLSLEFTRKMFTDREQAFGNSILFESGRLQFSSNKTKVELIRYIMPYGILTINQALEILNMPHVSDGDRRLQTLSVIDAEKAVEYQIGDKPQ
jgi:HK97 family phage portal protein